jgi:hypothetical protein
LLFRLWCFPHFGCEQLVNASNGKTTCLRQSQVARLVDALILAALNDIEDDFDSTINRGQPKAV